MTDTPIDIARPARRRKRPPAPSQKAATDSLYKGLDRFGLAPILLIALAYVGHTQVVVPIADAYARMVASVGENNKLLKEAVEKNDKEAGERVKLLSQANEEIRRLSEENRSLNQKILEAIAEADAARMKVHAETREALERVERALTASKKP